MKTTNYLISVVGPTAVGKTTLAIKLANLFECEILSADSRQFYKELEIGTAKPSLEELDQAKHHFINSLSILDSYDVGNFETDALTVLSKLYSESDTALMVGGSGLFVNAVCYGMDDLPEVKEGVREKLINEYSVKGLAFLNAELEQKDPAYFMVVDQRNPQRIMRALEVIRSTGKPFSDFRSGVKVERPFKTIWIGLEMDREKLYDRIEVRMDQMIIAGLFDEAERFYDLKHLNALQTVGYKEIYGFLDGEYDREEAIRLLKRNSRRYAKRQMTWFKKNQEITWFSPSDLDSIVDFIRVKMKG